MNKNNLKKSWQQSEENQKNFSGWDFSYLENKYFVENLPWRYTDIVLKYLKDEMQLLDMGTGGGELLQTFHHPPKNTAVTEGWLPNYQLLLKTLQPKGVKVEFVLEDDFLNFPNHSFDIITNSHESFSIAEVKRVLKPNGLFITQQVGDLNGIPLSSKLIPDFRKENFSHHLATTLSALKKEKFSTVLGDECYLKQKFFDMDALIYYVKTIPWEFPNFSVENNFEALLYLHEELARRGFIESQEHRFIVVARNL